MIMREGNFLSENNTKHLWPPIALRSLRASIILSARDAGWKGAAK